MLFYIAIFLLSLISFALIWTKRNYSNIGFDEIMFHLSMPLEGTARTFVTSFIKRVLVPSVCVLAVICVLFWIASRPRMKERIRRLKEKWHLDKIPAWEKTLAGGVLLVVWLALNLWYANRAFAFFDYVKNQVDTSSFIEEEYVFPADVQITFPEKKRNLVWIYLESAESSMQDKANGGLFDRNVIPEMTQIAKDNISFSQSDLLEGAATVPGTTWTMGALVAQTSGLPLKLYMGGYNVMKGYSTFMPKTVALGDILEEEGYHNFFLAGSNFTFGGRRSYFQEHGNYQIWDYLTAIKEEKIPSDYKVWWGFEDKKLYAFAKEQLLNLAQQDEPFNFSMLTVDTHHPQGYVCDICPDTYDDQFSNVWACASAQLNEFLEWLKQQDFYENTTVVITGDHCSMNVGYFGEKKGVYNYYTDGRTERKVYNAIVNCPIEPEKENGRLFTTMDFFPTVLASLGAEIEGNRLGLGTNLFSGEQTLAEKYGYEYMFGELSKKSTFYNKELFYP